jgi:MoxR-like ATPase
MTDDTEHPTLPEAARPAETDLQQVQALHRAVEEAKAAIGQRIIGQREVVEHLLIALFSNGHALFVGVPGLAKTLLIQTLAEVLDLGSTASSSRPDLMPSDVTGTDVLEQDPGTGRRSSAS